jgi:hypothetical protein
MNKQVNTENYRIMRLTDLQAESYIAPAMHCYFIEPFSPIAQSGGSNEDPDNPGGPEGGYD